MKTTALQGFPEAEKHRLISETFLRGAFGPRERQHFDLSSSGRSQRKSTFTSGPSEGPGPIPYPRATRRLERSKRSFLWFALGTLWVVHASIVLGICASVVALPFSAPWPVALPLEVFIGFFTANKFACHLTTLENYLRRQLGLRLIGRFVEHYVKQIFYKRFAARLRQAEFGNSHPDAFIETLTYGTRSARRVERGRRLNRARCDRRGADRTPATHTSAS